MPHIIAFGQEVETHLPEIPGPGRGSGRSVASSMHGGTRIGVGGAPVKWGALSNPARSGRTEQRIQGQPVWPAARRQQLVYRVAPRACGQPVRKAGAEPAGRRTVPARGRCRAREVNPRSPATARDGMWLTTRTVREAG